LLTVLASSWWAGRKPPRLAAPARHPSLGPFDWHGLEDRVSKHRTEPGRGTRTSWNTTHPGELSNSRAGPPESTIQEPLDGLGCVPQPRPSLGPTTGEQKICGHPTPRGLLPTGAEGEDKVTDALSAMEYPHWLIVAGAILVVLGLLGLAFRQRLAPIEPTENRPVTKKGNNWQRSPPVGKGSPK